MRKTGRKWGAYRSGRRLAAAVLLVAGSAGFSQTVPIDGLLVSEAHARKARAARSSKGPSSRQPARRRAVQQLQAIQQLRAVQQATRTQQKLQRIQSAIAAQQQHAQKVQQMVTAARRMQRRSAVPPPAAASPISGAPKGAAPRPHRVRLQRALTQLRASRQAVTPQVRVRTRIQAMRNAAAKARARQPSFQAPRALSAGRHHKALLQSLSTRIRQSGHAFRSPGVNTPRVKRHAVFSHALTKLRGPSLRGLHHGGPRQARQQAIFKHIFRKLSHRFTKNTQPQAPVPTPVATPAPAPTPPATTTQAKTTTKPTNVQNSPPKLPNEVPETSLVTAALSIAKSATSSGGGGSGSSKLGGAMSKLGGPAQSKEADDDEPDRDGRIPRRVDRSDDDGNAPTRGIGSRFVDLRPMETLPVIGSYNPRQVLALDLREPALRMLASRQFKKIGEYAYPGLMGMARLTQLEIPPQENAVKSLETLKELVPESSFVLNRVYAPYRLSAAGRPTSGGIVTPGLGCTGDRCFGANLINWQPQAAACAQDVHIGIVDTGFDKSHPAFANTRYVDKTFAPPGSAEAPKDHGTGILALLAGSPATSTPGLVPNARYFFANAFYAESRGGQPISDTTEMMAALNWLIERKVAIVNLSFAGPKDPLVHYAIQEMARAGIVVVAAAGNEGPSAPPSYPAAYPEVIAVTAVDRNLAPYRYASRGAHIDVAAPGVGIWTALPGRKAGQQTGTSFAVPYVTAVLAMNHTQLGGLGAGDHLAPKRRALEVINGNVMRLGGPTQRSPIFGAGLVQAPVNCPPAAGVALAKAPLLPPSAWTSSVVPAAVKQAAPVPASSGWETTTVHAVAAKGY